MEKSLIKNYIYSNVLLIFNLAYPLIATIYINRIFSVEMIGEVSFALSIVTVFISLSSLGIMSYGAREIAVNKNNKIKLNKIFSELLILNIISVIFFLVIYFFIIIFFSNFYKYFQIFIILSLNILMSAFTLEWFYIGLEEYEYITKRSIVTKIISLIFMLIFIKAKEDFYLYIIFLVLGISLNALFNIFNTKKYVSLSLKNLELKKYFKELKYFYFQVIMGCLYNGTDQIILGINSTKDQVAYYSKSRQLISIIGAITISFTKTITPRINNNIFDKVTYRKLVNLSFNFLCLLTIPSFVGTFFLTKNILYIIGGEKFIPATNILRILTFLLIFSSLAVFLDNSVSIPNNKEKNTFYGNCGVMIISVVLALILTNKYGGEASALSIVIGEFIGIIIQTFFIKKQKLYLDFISGNVVKYIYSSFFMGVIIFFVKKLAFGYIEEFFISFIAGGISYLAFLYFFKEKLITSFILNILNKK